jgi:hypothetical protein
MCLIKIEETTRVATAPLKVYKILTSDNRSPFRYQEYHVGKNIPDSGKDIFRRRGRTIDGGYLHAYLTEPKASANLVWIQNSVAKFGRLKVVEMYIPTGTEYWLGQALK